MNCNASLSLLLIICFATCKAQSNSKIISLLYELNEKGEVKGNPDTLAIEYLDKEGNVLQKISTRRAEKNIFITTTIYNSKGESTSKMFDYGNGSVSRMDLMRDSNNFIISSKSYELNSNDTSWADYSNTYDKVSGTLNSFMINRNDSLLIGRFRTRYDSNKKIIEDTELDSLNNEITKNIYNYTASGNLLEQIYYEKGILISSTHYTYDVQKKTEAIQSRSSKKIKVKYIYQ